VLGFGFAPQSIPSPGLRPRDAISGTPLKTIQMRNYSLALLAGALVCSTVGAQTQVASANALQRFQADHPFARVSGARFQPQEGPLDELGTTTLISGTTFSTGDSAFESAERHLAETRDMLPEQIGTLEPEVHADGVVIRGVMWDRETQSYKLSTFRFRQSVGGVPVFRSGVGFLVRNETGNPLVMSSFNVKDLGGLDEAIVQNYQSLEVTPTMRNAARNLLNEQLFQAAIALPREELELTTSEEQLVIWAGAHDRTAAPKLALQFTIERGSVFGPNPLLQRQLVLASVETGEVLYSENLVENFDVFGTISGRATQGLNALECDPEAAVPLPYAEATVVGGNTVFADANGQYNVPDGTNGNVTVRSRLRGQYFEVFDDITGVTPELSSVISAPGQADFLHNPTPNVEFSTSGVNAYVEANRVRDYTLFYAPSYPTIGTQTFFDIFVNQDEQSGITSCNAIYTGNSMVFWRNSGGCNNTAFSDVVHHEYGHHLIQVTGNGQGQLGEGSGDCMGVLIQDDPVLGQGFSTCNQGIRNANNSLEYPCSGGIHFCGQTISGCVWDLRNELIQTEPADYRDIGASLFINMLIVRGQMLPGNPTIDPTITVIYLTLDDDDSEIGNGTPHYNEIATAFAEHNMDAPPLVLLTFDYPTGRPDIIDPAGGVVEFTVEVAGLTGTPAPGTGMLHLDRGNGIETFPLNQQSPNVYEAVFPAIDCGLPFTYYFSAEDTLGAVATDPADISASRYEAVTGASPVTNFSDDFETDQGWTVSGNATDGQWTRGVPVGGGDRGDPPMDADGSGQCHLTDNVDGNTDVDGGSTILTSPVMDAMPAVKRSCRTRAGTPTRPETTRSTTSSSSSCPTTEEPTGRRSRPSGRPVRKSRAVGSRRPSGSPTCWRRRATCACASRLRT